MSLAAVEILLSAASRSGASIQLMPSRIAIFGGALPTEAEIREKSAPKSQRDAFVRWLKSNRSDLANELLLPESYDDWNDFNTYSDLLRFEEDLGYVTSVVVIFLEAPGSIAELGAFSQIVSLNQQLVLVVLDSHHPKKSFISLGPLRQLEEAGKSSVCVIPKRDLKDFELDIDVILSQIEDKLRPNRMNRALSAENKQHQIVLALDAITILEMATFTDVKTVLNHFGAVVNDARVRQVLFTLEKSGLVATRRYGGIGYYYPAKRAVTWIDYSGPDPSRPFNRVRISAKIASLRERSGAVAKAHDLVFGGSSAS